MHRKAVSAMNCQAVPGLRVRSFKRMKQRHDPERRPEAVVPN
jgi:hypothetical protein